MIWLQGYLAIGVVLVSLAYGIDLVAGEEAGRMPWREHRRILLLLLFVWPCAVLLCLQALVDERKGGKR